MIGSQVPSITRSWPKPDNRITGHDGDAFFKKS